MARERRAPDWLVERPFAHRGLHGPGIPENSLAAARAAIAAGYGIEGDVRLSRDGVPHVFHDARLARLTGSPGSFRLLDSAQLKARRLASAEPIPPLADLLALTGAATPLLIELKSGDGPLACARLCAAVAGRLEGQPGRAAVMSFDPLVSHWFARHRPSVPRGLVFSRRHRRGIIARIGTALAIARARPHFLACDVHDLPHALAFARPADLPLLCWTVRTPQDRNRATRRADQIIFETIF